MLYLNECYEFANSVIIQHSTKHDDVYILQSDDIINGENFVKYINLLFRNHCGEPIELKAPIEQQYKIFIENGKYQELMNQEDYKFDVHFFDSTFYRVLFEDCYNCVRCFIGWLYFTYEDEETLRSIYDINWSELSAELLFEADDNDRYVDGYNKWDYIE